MIIRRSYLVKDCPLIRSKPDPLSMIQRISSFWTAQARPLEFLKSSRHNSFAISCANFKCHAAFSERTSVHRTGLALDVAA